MGDSLRLDRCIRGRKGRKAYKASPFDPHFDPRSNPRGDCPFRHCHTRTGSLPLGIRLPVSTGTSSPVSMASMILTRRACTLGNHQPRRVKSTRERRQGNPQTLARGDLDPCGIARRIFRKRSRGGFATLVGHAISEAIAADGRLHIGGCDDGIDRISGSALAQADLLT